MITDSSFLISFFEPDDVNHAEAVRFAAQDPSQIFVVPDRVLEETLTAAIYKKGMKPALQLLEKIQKNRQIIVRNSREEEIQSTLTRISQVQRKLSFVDYLIVELSLGLKTPVASFDRQLNQLRQLLG